MKIGPKLKRRRILMGLTQEELADRTELSKGFISQLERDLTSPSIATLTDILQCLGMTLGEFFSEESDEQVVFGENDYFEKEDASLKNTIEWIIPNAQKNMMEPIRLTIAPGGSTYPDNPMRGRSSGMSSGAAWRFTWEITAFGQRRANPSITAATNGTIFPAGPAPRSSGSARRPASDHIRTARTGYYPLSS